MRKLIIAVLIIVGLGIAADFGAAAAAEYTVANQLSEQFGPSTEPSVRINGFPFLTQAVAGQYSAVDVRASGVPADPLRNLDVEATLHDVDAPLAEAISGELESVHAAQVDGRIRIKDSDLGRAIGIEDLRIQRPSDQESAGLLPAGSSSGRAPSDRAAIRLVATTDLLGQRTEIIGVGLIELTGDQVRITARDVRLARDGAGEVGLPGPIRRTLLKTLSTDLKPGGLPFTVTPTSVSVETGAVVVEGTARDVTISQPGVGTVTGAP